MTRTTRAAFIAALARLVSLLAAEHVSAAAVHVSAPVAPIINLLFHTCQYVCVCAVFFALLVQLVTRTTRAAFIAALARLVSLLAAEHVSAAAVHVSAPVAPIINLLFHTCQYVCVCAVYPYVFMHVCMCVCVCVYVCACACA